MKVFQTILIFLFLPLCLWGANLKTTGKSKGKNVESPLSLSLSYYGSEDLLEKEPRDIGHGISIGTSYRFLGSMSAGISTGMSYVSEEKSILYDDRNSPLQDTSLSLSISNFLMGKQKFKHSISAQIPTSDQSQYEKLRTVLGYGNATSFALLPVLSLNPRAGILYFMQTYDYSPTSRRANPVASTYLGADIDWSINKHFSFSVGGQVSATQRTDGEQSVRAFNSVALSASFGSFSSSLSYSNNEAADPVANLYAQRINVVEYDEYRQIVAWSLAWAF